MLIKLNTLLILLFFNCVVFAQTNEVLLTIEGNKIYKKDFIGTIGNENFIKFKQNPDTMKKWLDDFIDFKLKAIEAKNLGLDKSERYTREVNDFGNELAAKYLIDQDALNYFVNQTYERSKTEIWFKQILLRISPDAAPKDSILAYQKALSIRKKLIEGSSFELLANHMSDEPAAAINNGDLWYTLPLKIPLAVENYIYSEKPLKISYPIRSIYGYHIVEIIDKRDNPGRYKVAHILLSKSDDKDTTDINTQQKADSIYRLAINGVDFSKLAQDYSQDYGTSSNGGELPWFGTGDMPREFEQATINLTLDGAISKPVKTNYGWHIIKRISHEGYPAFNQIKEQVYNMVLAGEKGKLAQKKQIEMLKNEYNFKDYNSISPFFSLVDSTIFEGNWKIPFLADFEEKIFSINDKNYYQKDFAQFLEENQKETLQIPIVNYVLSRYDKFVDESVIDYESNQVKNKYPQISAYLNQFIDKTLVGYLMETAVWQKASNDENGLIDFYKKNIDNYNKTYVADVCIYSYKPDKANKILKQYKTTAKENISGTELENFIQSTVDKDFKLINCGKFEEGEDEFVNQCIDKYKNGNLTLGQKLIFIDNHGICILLNEDIRNKVKSLDEISTIANADYQSYLTQSLIKNLRQKYKVTINQTVFDTLIKN